MKGVNRKFLKLRRGYVDISVIPESKRVSLFSAANVRAFRENACDVELTPSELRRVISALQVALGRIAR